MCDPANRALTPQRFSIRVPEHPLLGTIGHQCRATPRPISERNRQSVRGVDDPFLLTPPGLVVVPPRGNAAHELLNRLVSLSLIKPV